MKRLIGYSALVLFLLCFTVKVQAFGNNIYSFSNERFSLGLTEVSRNTETQNKTVFLFPLTKISFTEKQSDTSNFFKETGIIVFLRYEKENNIYHDRNIEFYINEKDRSNKSFQILFPFVPYARFGDEKTSLRFIQFGKRTLALYEFKF